MIVESSECYISWHAWTQWVLISRNGWLPTVSSSTSDGPESSSQIRSCQLWQGNAGQMMNLTKWYEMYLYMCTVTGKNKSSQNLKVSKTGWKEAMYTHGGWLVDAPADLRKYLQPGLVRHATNFFCTHAWRSWCRYSSKDPGQQLMTRLANGDATYIHYITTLFLYESKGI